MPKIVLIIILIVAIIAGVYLATNRTSLFPQAEENLLSEGVVVSNIKPDSFAISYTTQNPVRTLVNYGTGADTSKSATDPRGDGQRKTHYAEVSGLNSDTEYSVKIGDQAYQVSTAQEGIGSSISKSYQGNVATADKSPIKEGIVYFRLKEGELLSAPLDSDGSFSFNLSGYKIADLSAGYEFTPAAIAEFFVQSDEGVGYYSTLAGANQPVNILIERTFIPFFRIQQGPLITN